MADKKFYIVPNRRTVTSGMKESGSYFLCPTNAVMTGRYHSGDENGQTQYEYATQKTMIINLVFILLSTISIYGQTASTVKIYRNTNVNYTSIVESNQPFDYKQTREWKKFRRLCPSGWTAFSLGLSSTVVCTLGASLDDMRDNKKKERGWKAAIGLSVCLLASSVPLLALAYENKRKAKSFSFTTSSLSVDLPNGEKQTQPALGLCLNF